MSDEVLIQQLVEGRVDDDDKSSLTTDEIDIFMLNDDDVDYTEFTSDGKTFVDDDEDCAQYTFRLGVRELLRQQALFSVFKRYSVVNNHFVRSANEPAFDYVKWARRMVQRHVVNSNDLLDDQDHALLSSHAFRLISDMQSRKTLQKDWMRALVPLLDGDCVIVERVEPRLIDTGGVYAHVFYPRTRTRRRLVMANEREARALEFIGRLVHVDVWARYYVLANMRMSLDVINISSIHMFVSDDNTINRFIQELSEAENYLLTLDE